MECWGKWRTKAGEGVKGNCEARRKVEAGKKVAAKRGFTSQKPGNMIQPPTRQDVRLAKEAESLMVLAVRKHMEEGVPTTAGTHRAVMPSALGKKCSAWLFGRKGTFSFRNMGLQSRGAGAPHHTPCGVEGRQI